jgi:signal transduction histidine kinase
MLPVIWDRRTRTILLLSQWAAIALGIFVTAATLGPTPVALGAAGAAGLYVLGSTSIPLDWYRRPLVLDGVLVLGVILTMVAVTLTGSASSPYLLLAITPTLWAGIFGGARQAFSTALFASGLLYLVEWSSEPRKFQEVLLIAGIQLLMAITISQVRRLLGDIQNRAARLEINQEANAKRIEQLQDAHDLLTQLSDLTAKQETNPIKLGNAALDNVLRRLPGSAAAAAFASERGPVLVARIGTEPPHAHRITIPLKVGNRETGWIMVAAPHSVSTSEVESISESLQPLALAFGNVQLIHNIAGRAITEERSRIARDLHDDLGPSLASLGLSLDLAMVQHPVDRPLADQLTQLRRSVSYLVDDIRKTVADLRAEPEPSMVSSLREVAARLPIGPELLIELDERRPPRPSAAQEIMAIIGEAMRNAYLHANAHVVRVSGAVDFDHGWVSVSDDGHGFDPTQVPNGHYGLVGMKERAERIAARLSVDSGPVGTTVSIEWGAR